MKLIKTNTLTQNQINDINNFLSTCSFNSSISFLDNDMNYYEDFQCFYIFLEDNNLCAFASCFIPDEACCEVYFHANQNDTDNCKEISNMFLDELSHELHKYDIVNTYFLFDGDTKLPNFLSEQLAYSYSEYLMQYNTQYTYKFNNISMSHSVTKNENDIIINTFLDKVPIGSCQVDYSNNYALIHHVLIDEKYRGLGYGTQTLLLTINELTQMNFTDIFLQVNSANTPAYSMYSHHGFVISEQIQYFKLL